MTDSSSTQCRGRTKQGERCKRSASADTLYCRAHQDQGGGEAIDTLSRRQRLFVEFFFANGLNAYQAAIDAGYSKSYAKEAYSQIISGAVKTVIDDRLAEHAMPANEALGRLSDWGRGTLAYFIGETGEVDLTTDAAKAHLHLVKKIKTDKYGRPSEVELHDPKDAVKTLAKIHGLVTDRVEHSGSVERVERPAYDYSVLSDDELDALEAITKKLEGEGAEPSSSD